MGKNIQRFGAVLDSHSKSTAKARTSRLQNMVELGTIQGDLSLSVSSLRTPIPKGDYMLALTLTGDFLTEDQSPSCSEGGTCTHNHRLPENEFRSIRAGDRVLVAWCGNEAVVISIVVAS